MHMYNLFMDLPSTHGGSAPTRLKTKSADACKALPMGCDLVYLSFGFTTPTTLEKFTNMAYLG